MRLEHAHAENPGLEEQRRLLESIMPIVAQLEDKGVTLNGSFPCQRVLSKFTAKLQRKVLEQCISASTQEQSWILSDILLHLDKIIGREEHINYMINKNPAPSKSNTAKVTNSAHQKSAVMVTPCLFCNATNHKSVACTKYATIEERRNFFRGSNRCLNCGARAVRNCGGKKHHHTLCPSRTKKFHSTPHQQSPLPGNDPAAVESTTTTDQRIKLARNVKREWVGKQGRTHAHTLGTGTLEDSASLAQSEEEIPNTGTVLASLHNKGIHPEKGDNSGRTDSHVVLLTGVAQVRDTLRNQWKDVEVLLDTGADESFISTDLADELGLECTTTRKLHVYTFGTVQPKNVVCNVTTLELWDKYGIKHKMHLHTL
ncbi:hypothetical protein OSTOST_02496, partial [Ostertagia ostertagi]